MANQEQYFDKEKTYTLAIKVLAGFVISLIIVLLILVRSYINIASNKTVIVQVPQILPPGEYGIGADAASENVFAMWSRIWVQQIGSFSYKDVDGRYESLMPFIDAQTAYKSKSDILSFIKFVKANFITQEFKLNDIKVERVSGNYYKVTAFGTINRMIGQSEDQLNGMRYAYTFLCYVRNGNIYIKSINSSFFGLNDVKTQEQLKFNKFVHFEEVLQ